MKDPNCLFCKIVEGESPAKVVHKDERVIAFEDINPQAPMHVLVVPVDHHSDVHDVPGETLAHMYAVARHMAGERGVGESGYRMVFNIGPNSGQTIFHAHLHVLGGRRMAWPPG